MLALHIALYALLGSALFLAIVQLGLTAYVVSYWGDNYSNYSIDFSGGYPYRTAVRASTPDSLALLVFAACWTILVTIAALVLPWLFTRKGTTTGKLNTILGIGFAVAYFVTMAFWLAGFGDLVAKTGGNWSDYVNAIIAFAVILWLIFLALLVLAILAICGVLVAEWPGYQSMRKNHEATAPGATNAPVTNAPAHDVPMSTTPVAPSELSTHDAEALHNQPPSQPHSTSSPSAIASVELSGDSIPREHHPGRP